MGCRFVNTVGRDPGPVGWGCYKLRFEDLPKVHNHAALPQNFGKYA